jgi:hypothetical protein
MADSLYNRPELSDYTALKLPDDLNEQNTAKAVRDVVQALINSQVNILDDVLSGATGPSLPPASNPAPFVPITANQFGQHPAFATQHELDVWLLSHSSVGTQPVLTGAYQVTPADYQAKCGKAAPANYSYPTGTGYSVINQAAADAQAKSNALSALTCAMPALTVSQLLPFFKAGPGIAIELSPDNKILISCTVAPVGGSVAQPEAPTNGVVNDTLKEFTFTVNPDYPSYTQYKESGRPGTTAAAYLSAATAYQVGSTVHVTGLAGAQALSLAYYVASSGAIPDGKPLLNNAPFTGTATTTGFPYTFDFALE